MSEKIIGYTLLSIGLIVIAIAAISVYQVFTGRAEPVALFSFPPIEISIDPFIAEENKAAIEALSGRSELPKTELVPSELLNDTTNIFAHVVLMGFLVSVGARVAHLGVNFLRPIHVHAPGLTLKEHDETKKI